MSHAIMTHRKGITRHQLHQAKKWIITNGFSDAVIQCDAETSLIQLTEKIASELGPGASTSSITTLQPHRGFGGGVAILHRHRLRYQNLWTDSQGRGMVGQLHYNGAELLLATMYGHVNDTDLSSDLFQHIHDQLIERGVTSKPCIFTGDFNTTVDTFPEWPWMQERGWSNLSLTPTCFVTGAEPSTIDVNRALSTWISSSAVLDDAAIPPHRPLEITLRSLDHWQDQLVRAPRLDARDLPTHLPFDRKSLPYITLFSRINYV